MKDIIARFLASEDGATSIEYGLIAAMIALVIISSVRRVGVGLNSKFAAISNNLT